MFKIKILVAGLLVALLMPVFAVSVNATGSIAFDKNNIVIYEDSAQGANQVDFQLDFNPEPTELVTINYSTNSQCLLKQESGGFTVGGALVSSAELVDLFININIKQQFHFFIILPYFFNGISDSISGS